MKRRALFGLALLPMLPAATRAAQAFAPVDLVPPEVGSWVRPADGGNVLIQCWGGGGGGGRGVAGGGGGGGWPESRMISLDQLWGAKVVTIGRGGRVA